MTAKEREEFIALIAAQLEPLISRLDALEARPIATDPETISTLARDLEGLRNGLGNFPTRGDYENAANMIQKNAEVTEELRGALARYEADRAMTGDTLTDDEAANDPARPLSSDELATLRRRVLV